MRRKVEPSLFQLLRTSRRWFLPSSSKLLALGLCSPPLPFLPKQTKKNITAQNASPPTTPFSAFSSFLLQNRKNKRGNTQLHCAMSCMFWYESMKFFFFFWCEHFQLCFIFTKMRFLVNLFHFLFCLICMPVGDLQWIPFTWSVSYLDGELLFSGFLRICQGFWSGIKVLDLQICW